MRQITDLWLITVGCLISENLLGTMCSFVEQILYKLFMPAGVSVEIGLGVFGVEICTAFGPGGLDVSVLGVRLLKLGHENRMVMDFNTNNELITVKL